LNYAEVSGISGGSMGSTCFGFCFWTGLVFCFWAGSGSGFNGLLGQTLSASSGLTSNCNMQTCIIGYLHLKVWIYQSELCSLFVNTWSLDITCQKEESSTSPISFTKIDCHSIVMRLLNNIPWTWFFFW